MRAVAIVVAAVGLASACLCAAAPPQAAPRQDKKVCILDGTPVVAFGSYDPMDDTPLDVQGRVSYMCNNSGGDVSRTGTPVTLGKLIVQISLSPGNGGTFQQRYLAGGRDRLRYNLYLDPQRTIVWGDGTSGSQTYSEHAQPNGHTVVVPVYGRIFAGQDVEGASYGDTIIVTLDF